VAHRFSLAVTVAVVAAALLAVALPGVAAAAPAGVDEYTVAPPKADGSGHETSAAPVSHPEDLPAAVRAKLASSSQAPLITEIATSKELGAPVASAGSVPGQAETTDPSTLSAVGDGLADGWALALIGGLALVALIAFTARRTGRRAG
jgi:hypothetical protein